MFYNAIMIVKKDIVEGKVIDISQEIREAYYDKRKFYTHPLCRKKYFITCTKYVGWNLIILNF